MLEHRRSYWKTTAAAALASAVNAFACAASRSWPFAGRTLFGFAALFCGAVAAGGAIALRRDALARAPRGQVR